MCFNGKIYAYNLIGQIIFQNKKNCQKSLNLEATIMDWVQENEADMQGEEWCADTFFSILQRSFISLFL